MNVAKSANMSAFRVVWPGALVFDGIASLSVAFSFPGRLLQVHGDLLGE